MRKIDLIKCLKNNDVIYLKTVCADNETNTPNKDTLR